MPDLLRLLDALPYLLDKGPIYGDDFSFALLAGLMNVAAASAALRPATIAALLRFARMAEGNAAAWLALMRALCAAKAVPLESLAELQPVLSQLLRYAEAPLRREPAVQEEKGGEGDKRDKKDKDRKKKKDKADEPPPAAKAAAEEEEEERVEPAQMFAKLFACEVLRRVVQLPYVRAETRLLGQVFDLAAASAKNDQFLETDMKGMQLAIAACLADASLEPRCVTLLLDALGTALLTPNEHVRRPPLAHHIHNTTHTTQHTLDTSYTTVAHHTSTVASLYTCASAHRGAGGGRVLCGARRSRGDRQAQRRQQLAHGGGAADFLLGGVCGGGQEERLFARHEPRAAPPRPGHRPYSTPRARAARPACRQVRPLRPLLRRVYVRPRGRRLRPYCVALAVIVCVVLCSARTPCVYLCRRCPSPL